MPARSGPLGFAIEAQGDDVAARHLQALAKRGGDPRPAFARIIEDLRRGEVEWFDTHGDGTWPPLAESTRALRAKQGRPATPLVLSGDLRRSLTVKRGSRSIRTQTRRQMRFGTKVYYGAFHARGDGVPKRSPLIPADLRTRRRMVDDIRDYLLGRGTREPLA